MDSAEKVGVVSRREKPEHPAPKVVSVAVNKPRAILFRFRLKKRPIGLPVSIMEVEGESIESTTGAVCVDAENAAVSLADAASLGLILGDAYVKLPPQGLGFCYVYLWYGSEEHFRTPVAKETAQVLAAEYSAVTWKYARIWSNPDRVLSVNLTGRLDGHPVHKQIKIERKV
jgi:hypothetical protein